MKKLFIFIIGIFNVLIVSAQIVKLHENVTAVSVVNAKVIFFKEVPAPENRSKSVNFDNLKDWARNNYGRDPFISSLRTDPKNCEIIVRSRIELVLPVDSRNISEKFVMRYRINGYVFDNRCVLEITDISYLYQGVKSDRSKSLPKVIRAEDFITDAAVERNDELKEVRNNVRKNTLAFINQLNKNFEVVFGHLPKP